MYINKVSIANLAPYLDKYEHFSFDLWLTLIRSNPLYKQKRNELFKAYFDIPIDIDTVAQTLRYYDVLANKMSEKTGLHIPKSQIYFLVLNALQIDIMTLSEDFMQGFYQAVDDLFLTYKPILLDDEIPQTFEYLIAANKTTNILSNTAFIHGELLYKVLAHYGIADNFTFQLYSDEVGLSKPNPQFFEHLFQTLNAVKSLPKNKIVHIGDNPYADGQGAAKAGLDFILIKS